MYLPDALSQRAKELGLSEKELCHKIGINQGNFSKWKKGSLLGPDPRTLKNQEGIYTNISNLLNISLEEVIASTIFSNKDEAKNKTLEAFSKHEKRSLTEVENKMISIGRNLADCIELTDVVIDLIKSYKANVKKQKWRN